jgi:hypothetical protein
MIHAITSLFNSPAVCRLPRGHARWIHVSVLAYAASFLLPVGIEGQQIFWGWAAFLMSFVGLLLAPTHGGRAWHLFAFCTVWMANPFYWLTLYKLTRGSQRGASIVGFIALVFASIPLPLSYGFLPCPGYFVWWLSILVLLILSLQIGRESQDQSVTQR